MSRKNTYLIAFQYHLGAFEIGFGTVEMTFENQIKPGDLPDIQRQVRENYEQPNLIVTAFSKFEG